MAKSKSCKPFLTNEVSVHGTFSFIKLDHITSHVLHINSPGATSGLIALFILSVEVPRYINLPIAKYKTMLILSLPTHNG